ncbi:MAG TPA: helix-turn-helix domain-containing protein [Bryobacteraceae bacterium]|nr:helix-turn-helix domain-containing protein [Bryobacteraceae bacterium]
MRQRGMTIPEAVKELGISRQSVHKAINKGHIRVVEVIAGRRLLNRADVEKYRPRSKTTEDKPK